MVEVIVALGIFLMGALVFGTCVFVVRRFVNASGLQPNNETVAHHLSIVIGLYGIFSGFVIASLWEQQREAETNIIHEASELRTISRLGGALGGATGEEVRKAALQYAQDVRTTEWAILSTGTREDIATLDHTHPAKDRIWDALMDYEPPEKDNDKKQLLYESLLSHFETLSESRRSRHYDAQRTLPMYLWMILILGSVLSIVCTLFIGTENLRSQALLTGISGGLLLLLLFVVNDLQNPFRGHWRAQPHAFELAQKRMEADEAKHIPSKAPQADGGDEVHP
jgi:hypothetical protein